MRVALLVLLISIFLMPKSVYSLTKGVVLSITLLNQIPSPVEPGRVVTVDVGIYNNGFEPAKNIILEIAEKDPFRLLPGESRKKEFSVIDAKSSVKATFKLRVDENAISNVYDLEFIY